MSREGFGYCYLLGCAAALSMLISSLVLVILARNQSIKLKSSYSGFTDSWNTDMIFDVTSDPSYTLPTKDYYLTELAHIWPGNIDGCYCTQSNSRMKVTKGLKDHKCNYNETRMGCSSISSMPEKNMTTWINGQKLYAVRIKDTSFLDTYKNINSDGSCVGFNKNCGSLNSKSKGACIPVKYEFCPLTSILSSATPNHDARKFVGFSFHVSRENNNNPMNSFSIQEDYQCFVKSNYPLAPGRYKYKLLNGDFTSCKKDSSAWSLSEMGERTFYDLNSFDYGRLPEYPVTDSVSMRVMVARMFEWSPSCSDYIQSMIGQSADISSIEYQYFVLIIVFSISFALNIFVIIGQCWCVLIEQKYLYLIGIAVRLVCFALAFPSVIITYVKTHKSNRFFVDILAQACSNDQTNSNFQELIDFHLGAIISRSKVILGLVITGFCIEIILGIVLLACFETSDEFLTKKRQDSSGAGYADVPTFKFKRNPGAVAPAGNKSKESDDIDNVDNMTNAGYPIPPGLDDPETKPLPPGFGELNKDPLPPGFSDLNKGNNPLPPRFAELDKNPLPPGFTNLKNRQNLLPPGFNNTGLNRPMSAPYNQSGPNSNQAELPPSFNQAAPHSNTGINTDLPDNFDQTAHGHNGRLPPLPPGFLNYLNNIGKPRN